MSPAATLALPLAADADGVVRLAGTRVTLDAVVAAFDDGATAEEIAQRYPSLRLADVYAVVAYVLLNGDEVREYLRERQARAADARGRHDASGIRARLHARHARAA